LLNIQLFKTWHDLINDKNRTIILIGFYQNNGVTGGWVKAAVGGLGHK